MTKDSSSKTLAKSFSTASAFTSTTFAGNSSPYGPALAWAPNCSVLMLAWIGTNSGHTINLANSTIDGNEFGGQGTLPDSSNNEPALTIVNGDQLFIAWTGTDPASTLNVTYQELGVGTGTPGC